MYKFEPILKTLVWGTESWVLSAVPGSESVVSEGPDKGRTLTELYPGKFPLLVKFIDAGRPLSIQVHPDDRLAGERHGSLGKTEMWYVTGADKGATLMCGLKDRITPEQYAGLVADGSIVDALASYEVSEGDVFFIPAGRIHALGGGCRVAEIQQSSDITYRIYDYGRKGLDGKPRQLHTAEAEAAIDYTVHPDYRTSYERRPGEPVEIVSCPQFTTFLLEQDGHVTVPTGGMNTILVCLEGECSLCGTSLKAGESALSLDASEDITVNGKTKLLITHF